jgi:hypothetical protein
MMGHPSVRRGDEKYSLQGIALNHRYLTAILSEELGSSN